MGGQTEIEILQEEIAGIKKSLAGVSAAYDSLKKAVESDIKKIGNELKKLAKAPEVTSDKKEKPKEKEKLTIPETTFKVNGAEYKFTRPRFIWEGKPMTAKAALEDEKLLAAIVNKTGPDAAANGAGIIQQVK